MPRFQFFTYPHNQTTDFTYLNIDSEQYLENKKELLNQGFEIDSSPIRAEDADRAIELYQRDFSHISQEQIRGNLMYVIVEGVIAVWRWLRKKRT